MSHNTCLEALKFYDWLMYRIIECVAENDHEEVKFWKEKFSKDYKNLCILWKHFCRDRSYSQDWFLELEVEHIELQKRISNLETMEILLLKKLVVQLWKWTSWKMVLV